MKDNLFMAITGHDSVTGKVENEERRTRIKKRLLRMILTLSVAILPLTGSFFVANLVDIMRYAGLLGFAKCYFYPAVLQLKSQYDCNKVFYEAVEQSQPDNKSSSINKDSQEDEKVPLIADEFAALKYFHWKNPSYTTPYHTVFSHPYMVVVLSLFSIVAFGLTIASLPIQVHQDD